MHEYAIRVLNASKGGLNSTLKNCTWLTEEERLEKIEHLATLNKAIDALKYPEVDMEVDRW